MKRFCNRAGRTAPIFAGLAAALVLAGTGCRAVAVQANGDQRPDPVVNAVYYGTYWNHWWGETPQQTLDRQAQKQPGGAVSASGLYRMEVETNALYDLAALCTLGLFAPVHVTCWLQADAKANVLPPEVRHARPGRNAQ